jgi:hypothetical protein
MARKTLEAALAETRKERKIRWHYLVRHPGFRAEVRTVRDAFEAHAADREQQRRELVQRWNLQEYPLDLLLHPKISPDLHRRFHYYDSFAEKELVERPVRLSGPESLPASGSSIPTKNKSDSIALTVDLSYPIDVLLPLIHEELRTAKMSPSTRKHRDKEFFKLDVFDRALEGFPFYAIAQQFKAKESTVKSAFLVACRNIFGITPVRKKALLGEYIQGHDFEHCPICSKVKTADDLCPVGKVLLAKKPAE